MLKEHKVHAFIGMFGSGKTEISLNIAIHLKQKYDKVAIADIDTISPYFRTRDELENLNRLNIEVITPPHRYMVGDLPIISARVGGFVTNPLYKTVLDVGGNDDGAVVFSSLNNFVKKVDTAVYFVINTKRPFTDSKKKILQNIYRLSNKARMNIDYLVCNSNLLDETDQKLITNGEKIVEEVSKESEIPIAFTVISDKINNNIITKYPKFEIKRFMKNIF